MTGHGRPDGASPVAGAGGFTLLEVIIAMTLVAIILAEISGTLWGGIRATEKGRARSDALERYRTVTSLVRDQLGSTLPLKSEQDGEIQLHFLGEEDRLEFASPVSLWGGGVVVTEYVLRETDEKGIGLYSTEIGGNGVVLGGGATMLMEGFTQAGFRYLERASAVETKPAEWLDSWDKPQELPRAVSITLTAGESETVLVIPLGTGKVGT